MNRIIFALLFIPCVSIADVIETWTCTEPYRSEVLAVASVNDGRESGQIKVAGVIHGASFETRGFERRWDFGLADDYTYNYAFVIKPNGDALYYDFSDANEGAIVKPSIIMKCTKE